MAAIRELDRLPHLEPHRNKSLILETLKTATPENMVKRDETIPLAAISLEESIVSSLHANTLANNILQRGQLSRIVVRAREIRNPEGEPDITYDIVDGFHRTEGLNQVTEDVQTINATVMYGMSDEEMYDQRLLALNSIEAIKLPRLARWLTSAYNFSEFSDKVSIVDAFTLAEKTRVGNTIKDLSVQESNNLRFWVLHKCEKWQKSSKDMATILSLVKDADPELVDRVRTVKGQSGREPGTINRSDLTIIVGTFAGERNYPIQNAIAAFIDKHSFIRYELSQLISIFAKQKISPESTPDAIHALLNKIYQEDIRFASEFTTRPEERKGDTIRGTELFLPSQQSTIQPTIYHRTEIREPVESVALIDGEELTALQEKNAELQEQLEEAAWWNYVPELSDEEKALSKANAELRLAQYIKEAGISPQDAQSLLRGVKTKRNAYLSQKDKTL